MKEVPPKAQATAAIRYALLPSASKDAKRLAKKCRRIRHHFDGLDNIESVAVTVSLRAYSGAQLIGIKIRAASAADVETLDASESYVLEACEHEQAGLVALNYSLITVILLMLNGAKTVIFFDADSIALPETHHENAAVSSGTASDGDNNNDLLALHSKLTGAFNDLAFTPVHKGTYLEQLRTRLFDLMASDSNEIKLGNIKEVIKSCL